MPWGVVALVFLAVSCSGGPTVGGPLDQGYEPGELCTPVGPDHTVTVGIDVLVNSGPEDVVIEGVTLDTSDPNISMIDAVLVPIRGGDLVGIHPGFPPDPENLPPGIDWSEAVQATGGHIGPTSANEISNLVVGLALASGFESASATGIEVIYAVGDRTYKYTTPTEIEVMSGPCTVQP